MKTAEGACPSTERKCLRTPKGRTLLPQNAKGADVLSLNGPFGRAGGADRPCEAVPGAVRRSETTPGCNNTRAGAIRTSGCADAGRADRSRLEERRPCPRGG